MAKKGYPGLVLVPPSDRTILRRRLLLCALVLIALAWGASTLPIWPPASDDKANCQPGVGQEGSTSSIENCGQPQSAMERPSKQDEFSLTTVSQAEGLGESQHPPSSTLDPNQLVTQANRGEDSKPTPSSLANHPSDHNMASPDNEKTASRVLASKPTRNPEGDVHVTDRLAAQHNHSQDSKPKSFEQVDRPTDHNAVPPGSEKSASSLPASKPAQDLDLEIRLAGQGDAFAQYRLGRYYAQRDGRQTLESVSWYKKASPGLHRLAETGNGQAMYVLGVMYAYGRGVPRSPDEARRWLTRAVEHKITAAQPVLAKLAVHAHTNPKITEQAKDVNRQN